VEERLLALESLGESLARYAVQEEIVKRWPKFGGKQAITGPSERSCMIYEPNCLASINQQIALASVIVRNQLVECTSEFGVRPKV